MSERTATTAGPASATKNAGAFSKWGLTLAIVSILVVTGITASGILDQPENRGATVGLDGCTQTITYNANGASVGGNLTVGYYGIASTEYNPELWAGANTHMTEASNWVGPTFTKAAKVQITVNMTVANGNNYTISLPDGYSPDSASVTSGPATVTKNAGTGKFDVAGTGDGSAVAVLTVTTNVTFNKVFGGWNTAADGSGVQYLPGDVVPGNVIDVYAIWIQPDIFSYKFSKTASWSGSDYAVELSLTKSSLDNQFIWPFCPTGVSGSNIDPKASNFMVTYGDSRTGYSMYGTIYKLDWENFTGVYNTSTTYTSEYESKTLKDRIFALNNTALPTGTYRSLDPNATKSLAHMVQLKFVNQSYCTGNVIIDSVNIDSDGGSKHGDSGNYALYAEGHVLVMGPNMRNSTLTSGNPSNKNGPQIYGGMRSGGNIYSGGIDKTMVFERFRDGPYDRSENYLLQNGTFVRDGAGNVPAQVLTLITGGEYNGKYIDSFGNYWNNSAGTDIYEYRVFKDNSSGGEDDYKITVADGVQTFKKWNGSEWVICDSISGYHFHPYRANTITVKAGTCVIIHSGIYSNVIAGSFSTKTNGGSNGHIGKSDYPMSTYLVMKGGTVTDTLCGAMSGADGGADLYGHISNGNGFLDGGTFIYMLDDAFMSADKWEDKQCNIDYTWGTVESSVLEGGSSKGQQTNQSIITGCTHVFLSGSSSVWDVQAGGRSEFTHTDYSYLEITGKATVRHIACGTITDGGQKGNNNCVDHTNVYVSEGATVAYVLGAGYDTWAQPKYQTMVGGTVTVTVAGGRVGNVFGGGFRGSIGTESSPVTVYVNITGGKVYQNVYGGGSGGLDKVKHNNDGTMSGQTSGAWTVSMGKSYVYGDTHVTVSGDAVIQGDVYGGGMSVPKLSSYEGTLGGVFNSESGGVVATVFGSTNVRVEGSATVAGSVYGAGKGVAVTYSIVNGEVVYSFPDQTVMHVIDMNSVGADDPFHDVPWLVNSSGNAVFSYDSSLCKKSGSSAPIADGCRYVEFAKVTKNSSVVIDLDSDGVISGSVFGGSAYGKVTGNSSVTVVKGTIQKDVYGGGLGREDIISVSGTRTVYVEGDVSIDDTATSIAGVRIAGSVYGGSSMGDDGSPTLANYTNTTVTIRNGYIAKDVFGGGLMGNTYGSASVNIGYSQSSTEAIPYSYASSHTHGIVVDNVYGGGNVSTEYDEDGKPLGIEPFVKYLVKGNGTVRIYGDEGKRPITITGSVMASGNSCLTADKSIDSSFTTAIIFNGVTNRADSMTAIHRADTLTIIESVLKITGRSPLVKVGNTEKNMSIFGIGHMIMRHDSIVSIEDPADCVARYSSLSKDNMPSTVAAPSNELRFVTGSTFYVRDSDMNYGQVTGYTILSVETQDRYGAYVLGDAILSSNNGFVVYRDGSYERADYSDSSGVRCWFISGVVRKVMTMNLNAKTEGGVPVLTNVMSTVDIQKFQDGTQLRFTGGSFTALSSDGSKMYYFDRPGTVSDEYTNLGMIVGYMPDNVESAYERTMLYDRDSRYLDTGSGEKWLWGSYYAENGDTESLEPIRGYETSPERETRTLTPVTLQAYGQDNTNAGIYGLNLMFTATHSDRTSYVGYLILNLQESVIISYESIEGGQAVTRENVMTTNRTEIRVDLYIIGEGGSATSQNDYEVIMKTELPSSKSEGQVEIMIPTGFTNGELHLKNVTYTVYPGDTESVFERSYNSNAKIYVAAVTNQDKTTGWSTSSGLVQATSSMSDTTVGTLIGSISATVRYYVKDFTYEEDYPDYTSPATHNPDKRPQFTLHFYVLMNGEEIESNVTVTLIEKQKVEVTYYDAYRDPDYLDPQVMKYYEGTVLTESNMPSTGPNFIGWYYKGSDFSNVYDYGQPVNRAISLEARYTYVVTFDNQNGTSYTMYVPAEDGGTMLNKNAVPRPTSTGYTFVEWFTDSDCSRQWDYSMDRITGNTTLYAKWVGKEITVHFWYRNAENTVWVSFAGDTAHVTPVTDGSGNRYYVMMRAEGDVPIMPTVRYGSTFNTIDPMQSSGSSIVNILDFAKESIETMMGENVKFICWQAHRYNDIEDKVMYSVYSDTLATGDMVMVKPSTLSPGDDPVVDVIDLYAVTATVAIQLDMIDKNNDASVHIAAPSTFLVYPDEPSALSNTYDVYGYDNTIYVFRSDAVKKWNEQYQRWDTAITSEEVIRENGVFLFKWSTDFNGWVNGGSMRYYVDGDGNWYAVEDWNYKYIYDYEDGVYYGYDKYGNYYHSVTVNNVKGWELDYSYQYATSADVETQYKVVGSTWYILEGEEWVVTSEPANPYYKDRYGNHYEVAWTGSWTRATDSSVRTYKVGDGNTYRISISKDGSVTCQTGEPVYLKYVDGNWVNYDWSTDSWADNHFLDPFCSRYMYAGDIYKCTEGAEAYYIFTYQLNQATRSGYKLTGWHNDHVPEGASDTPSAGVNRTMYIFVDMAGEHTVIWREMLLLDGTAYQTAFYPTSQPRIDDTTNLYNVVYSAEWKQLDYTVHIGNTAHGNVNAYLVNNDGSRTQFTDVITGLHYGDRIELSYTPEGNYEFTRWVVSGEYSIDRVESASATLVVQGDCTISVSDVGDRVVTIEVYYDGDESHDAGRLTRDDARKTTAYLHNVDTGEYVELTCITEEHYPVENDGHEYYRGYVPLGNYTLCLRYDMGDYGRDEYELMGNVRVTAETAVDFSFYVLTARIKDACTTDTGEVVVDHASYPSGWNLIDGVLLVDESGNEVVRVSKYTGVIKSYLDPRIDSETVINNPEDGIPPVRFTVQPGYFFNIYEGFPDNVQGTDMFVVNDINRYPYGTTIDGNVFSGRFDLNWTRYWKPADVVVHIQPIQTEVEYLVDPSKSISWTSTGNVAYGQDFGLAAMTSTLDTYLATLPAPVKHVSGWFFDGMTRQVTDSTVFGPDAAARFGLEGTPVLTPSDTKYTDQYGNMYNSDDVEDLWYSIVYKVVNDVEEKYKIEGSSCYHWNGSSWESCSMIDLYYYKDGSNKFVLRSDGYKCFYITDDYCKLYADVVDSEQKDITVRVFTENLSGEHTELPAGMETFKITENGSVFEGTYPLDPIDGYSSSIVVTLENAGEGVSMTYTPQYDGTSGELIGVLISIAYPPSWTTKLVADIDYSLNTSTLVWDKVWDSDPTAGGTPKVIGNGWVFDAVSGKMVYNGTAKYGERVPLPYMNSTETSIDGWKIGDVDVGKEEDDMYRLSFTGTVAHFKMWNGSAWIDCEEIDDYHFHEYKDGAYIFDVKYYLENGRFVREGSGPVPAETYTLVESGEYEGKYIDSFGNYWNDGAGTSLYEYRVFSSNDSKFVFQMRPADSGPLTLTAVYHEDTVDVTFNTFMSSFRSTGYQSMKFTVPVGSALTAEQITSLALDLDGSGKYEGSAFEGWWSGDTMFVDSMTFSENTVFTAKWEIIYLSFLFGQDLEYTEIDATVTSSAGDNSISAAQDTYGNARNVGAASGDPFTFTLTVTGMKSKATADTKMSILGLPDTAEAEFEVTSSLGADDTVLSITITGTVAVDTALKIWVSTTADADVSATQDSSTSILECGSVNSVLFNSEITLTIKPPAGKTIDYDATIAASSSYDFGQPKALSENRGYRWSFQLTTDDIILNIKYKDVSVKIDFYVNGTFIDPTGAYKIPVTSTNYTGYGQDIPLYETVRFGNYTDDQGNQPIVWYTDPECTTKFDPNSTSGTYEYSKLMLESFSLYTYDRYVIVLHDSDGTGAYKIISEPYEGYVSIPEFIYDMTGKHKEHIFVGWAVETVDGHLYSYIPSGAIPTSAFSDKWIDLYAYYLTDGTYSGTFDGGEHHPRIENDDDNQIDIADISIVYSEIVVFDDEHDYSPTDPNCTGDYTIVHHTEQIKLVHFWVKTTAGGVSYRTVGTFMVEIDALRMFVIAASDHKVYDGTALEAGDNIEMRSIDGTVLPDTIKSCFSSIGYKTDGGYGSSITNVGTIRTGVLLTTAPGVDLTDFSIKYIDGTLTVYSQDSVVSETRWS